MKLLGFTKTAAQRRTCRISWIASAPAASQIVPSIWVTPRFDCLPNGGGKAIRQGKGRCTGTRPERKIV